MEIEIYLRGVEKPLTPIFVGDVGSKMVEEFQDYIDHRYPRGGSYPFETDREQPKNLELAFDAVAYLIAPPGAGG